MHTCLHAMKLFLLLVQLLTAAVSVESLSPEGWALLDFRSNIEVDSEHALRSWSAYDETPCDWFGVFCKKGKVTSIQLSELSLKGTLSPELGKLVDLQELVLRGNLLSGSIPFQLGELKKLEVLDLAHNQLSGWLPESLGYLSNLRTLYLENNILEGVIPAKLGELKLLCEQIFNVKKLDGIIPESLSTSVNIVSGCASLYRTGIVKRKHLNFVNFSSNYFEGRLPSCLQHLSSASFFLNCLSREGFMHQRPVRECKRVPSSISRRLLADSDGVVTNETAVNTTAGQPFNISTSSPAPSPSARVQDDVSQAPAPTASDEPSASPVMAASSSPDSLDSASSSSDAWKRIIIGFIVAIVAIGLAIPAVFLFLRYRHRYLAVIPYKSSMSGELQKEFKNGVTAFSRAELLAACEDFSNIIGSSPDIVLFKGALANSTHDEIAVTSIRKSAKSWSSKSEQIFWRKVECLSQMKHGNIVKLLGYCAEEEPFIRMLVFEYVPNGTVYEHLHNKDFEHLDWAARMKIIMGVANALDYMHSSFGSPITHTKLDATSVFLTEDFSPKVADFGLWKSASTQRSSSGRLHDQGHEDLELSDRLVPNLETNTHDFGYFILEVITGKLPQSRELGSLAEWAWSHISPTGKAAWIVDPTLQSYESDELDAVARIAYDCLQDDNSRTLTMTQVASDLRSSLSSDKEFRLPNSSPLRWAELQILSQD